MTADLVIRAAKLYTMDPAFPVAAGLAVQDGRPAAGVGALGDGRLGQQGVLLAERGAPVSHGLFLSVAWFGWSAVQEVRCGTAVRRSSTVSG